MSRLAVVCPWRQPLCLIAAYRLPQESRELQHPLSARCLRVQDVEQPQCLQVPERGADVNRLCNIAPQGGEQPGSGATLPRYALGGFTHDAEARVFFAQANTEPHRQGRI